MWLGMIKDNLKVVLEALMGKPYTVIIACLLVSNSFFVKQWVTARNDCQEDLERVNNIAFDRMIQLYELQRERENDRRYIDNIDSIIRSKLEEPIKDLKENVEIN